VLEPKFSAGWVSCANVLLKAGLEAGSAPLATVNTTLPAL
jgi:hypothetical protein